MGAAFGVDEMAFDTAQERDWDFGSFVFVNGAGAATHGAIVAGISPFTVGGISKFD